MDKKTKNFKRKIANVLYDLIGEEKNIDDPNFIIAEKAYGIAEIKGNLVCDNSRGGFGKLNVKQHHHYGCNGLAIDAYNGGLSIHFGGELVYSAKYVDNRGRKKKVVTTYKSGVWENMIDILYENNQEALANKKRIENAKNYLVEVQQKLSTILQYSGGEAVKINDDIIIQNCGNNYDGGYNIDDYHGEYLGTKVFVNDTCVYYYDNTKINGICKFVTYIPGEWEQLLDRQIVISKQRAEEANKQKQTKLYEEFLRTRS